MYRFVLSAVLILGLAGFASADPLQLGYTVMGTGGLSGPAAGFSNSSFWWADTSGNVAESALANYGFVPYTVPAGQNPGYSSVTGSLLLSSAFTIGAGQSLNVTTTAITDEAQDSKQLDFALLLENSQLVAVLSNISPDGSQGFGDFVIGQKALASAGVTTTILNSSSGEVGDPFTLGSYQYNGAPTNRGSLNTSTELLSSYAPGAGTYQLLFGAFFQPTDAPSQSAMTVQSVSMPEEGTRTDLLISAFVVVILGLLGWRAMKPACATV
jgi:hypothetical protein